MPHSSTRNFALIGFLRDTTVQLRLFQHENGEAPVQRLAGTSDLKFLSILLMYRRLTPLEDSHALGSFEIDAIYVQMPYVVR